MQTETTSTYHWTDAQERLILPLLQTERLGIITDMDGTVSHVVERPEAAVVTPRNRKTLSTLVLLLPLVAAVSGRSARDLHARMAIPGMVYIGNHGLERWQNGGRILNNDVRKYRKALATALDELRPQLTVGMWIEDKYATASVHYRLTPNPDEAKQELEPIISEIAAKYGLHANGGRRLFEIRPPIEANKGTALNELFHEHELDAVIFLGDDVTDIDAMKMNRRLRDTTGIMSLNVGVIPTEYDADHAETIQRLQDASDVYAHDVNDIERLLSWMLDEVCKLRS